MSFGDEHRGGSRDDHRDGDRGGGRHLDDETMAVTGARTVAPKNAAMPTSAIGMARVGHVAGPHGAEGADEQQPPQRTDRQ